MLDNWQRIEKIVNWTGLSVNAFARGIGLKRAENLYQIKKGNYGISKSLAQTITAKYPCVNRFWLLSGVGEPFLYEGQNIPGSVPYYKDNVIKLIKATPQSRSPIMFLNVPPIGSSDIAAISIDAAMEPDLPSGVIVFIKHIDHDAITSGTMCLVISHTFSGIRRVHRESGSSQVRLVPTNKVGFEEVMVDLDDVNKIYEVKGYIQTF